MPITKLKKKKEKSVRLKIPRGIIEQLIRPTCFPRKKNHRMESERRGLSCVLVFGGIKAEIKLHIYAK